MSPMRLLMVCMAFPAVLRMELDFFLPPDSTLALTAATAVPASTPCRCPLPRSSLVCP